MLSDDVSIFKVKQIYYVHEKIELKLICIYHNINLWCIIVTTFKKKKSTSTLKKEKKQRN